MTPTDMADAPVNDREKKEQTALEKVKAWEVKTPEDYSALDAFLVYLLDLKKLIIADFKDSKEKTAEAKRMATAAHKAVCDQEEGHLGVVEDARRIGKAKLSAYEEEGRKEQARLQAEADAAAKKEADDRALELAALAEKTGDHDKAEAIMAKPEPVAAPRVASFVPQRSTVVSKRWGAVIGGDRIDGSPTDAKFVLKAIEAAGKVLAKSKAKDAIEAAELLRQAHTDAQYMVYDQVALNRQATATKDALKLGGVAFISRSV